MFIEKLKQAKQELKEAKEIKCDCVEECNCERLKRIKEAQKKIDDLISTVL